MGENVLGVGIDVFIIPVHMKICFKVIFYMLKAEKFIV